MIDSISIDLLPAIVKIIEDTQKTLKILTGVNIKLQLVVVDESVNYQEIMWLSLQQSISIVTKTSWSEISGGSRAGYIPLYKKLYCHFGKTHIGGKSLKQIASDVGMKNHTSALAAATDFKDLISDPLRTDHDYALRLYQDVKKRLKIEV